VRAFLACRLDPSAAAALHKALNPLRANFHGRPFRWVAPDNYHLTLRFIGTLEHEAAAAVGDLIEPIAARERCIECSAGAPLPLPNARRPHVVALPIESNGRLEQLAGECNDALASVFGAPDKPFRAHLTVIRCRLGARIGALDAPFTFPFRLSSFGLYESALLRTGARYTALAEFALK
jgi:RNA 2',3'-cyclic 3'-phosphodiesterase